MKRKKGFSLIKLLVVIAVIGIIAVLVLIALSLYQKSTHDGARKSTLQEIQKVNKTYWDRNNDYASDVGDTTANCASAAASTLVGAKLIGCPSQKARTNGADVTWDSVYIYTDSSHWSATTELEKGGSYTCNQDGCH